MIYSFGSFKPMFFGCGRPNGYRLSIIDRRSGAIFLVSRARSFKETINRLEIIIIGNSARDALIVINYSVGDSIGDALIAVITIIV
ncbi:MAG: hypothetical protein CMJ52_09275 [Planctomycetaceae bacterium]|nr:hypothetical protein [Planctomycetaceae bacterium]